MFDVRADAPAWGAWKTGRVAEPYPVACLAVGNAAVAELLLYNVVHDSWTSGMLILEGGYLAAAFYRAAFLGAAERSEWRFEPARKFQLHCRINVSSPRPIDC